MASASEEQREGGVVQNRGFWGKNERPGERKEGHAAGENVHYIGLIIFSSYKVSQLSIITVKTACNGSQNLCLECKPLVQDLNWIVMNPASVQWESDLWTLRAIRSYYGPCKFSHNDCKKTCNGKINHRSMHLLRSHQRHEESAGWEVKGVGGSIWCSNSETHSTVSWQKAGQVHRMVEAEKEQ